MGPYAGVDCNLTLYPLQSRLQHILYQRPWATLFHQSRILTLYASVNFIPLVMQGLWIRPRLKDCVAVSFLLVLDQNRFERKWETSFPDTEHQFSQLGRCKIYGDAILFGGEKPA
jgi:hypothetical protein